MRKNESFALRLTIECLVEAGNRSGRTELDRENYIPNFNYQLIINVKAYVFGHSGVAVQKWLFSSALSHFYMRSCPSRKRLKCAKTADSDVFLNSISSISSISSHIHFLSVFWPIVYSFIHSFTKKVFSYILLNQRGALVGQNSWLESNVWKYVFDLKKRNLTMENTDRPIERGSKRSG